MPGGSSRGARPPLDAQTAARLRGDLVAFLAHRTRNAALAEDLAQEALLRVLAGLPRFRGAAALRTWGKRIAANVWRDHLRRQAASPTERAARGDPFSVTALLDALGPGAPAAPAEETLDREATHHCLLDAVRRLPLDARRILLLHDFGEMSLAQASAALGCSVGAAKVRLHRARRRLAERCRAECIGETGAGGAVLCTPKGDGLDLAKSPAGKPPTRRRT
jgi:RNA polymerase sigma-70 factor (ECF subfamily)